MAQVRSFVGSPKGIESDINKWINSESPEKLLDIKLVEISKTTLNESEFFALIVYENPT